MEEVWFQLKLFGVGLLFGMAAAVGYETLLVFDRKCNCVWKESLRDFFCFLLLSIFLFAISCKYKEGQVRGYMTAATVLGIGIYIKFLRKKYLKYLQRIYKMLWVTIEKIQNVALQPLEKWKKPRK